MKFLEMARWFIATECREQEILEERGTFGEIVSVNQDVLGE